MAHHSDSISNDPPRRSDEASSARRAAVSAAEHTFRWPRQLVPRARGARATLRGAQAPRLARPPSLARLSRALTACGHDVFVITYRFCVQKRAVLRRDAGVFSDRLSYLRDGFVSQSLVQLEFFGKHQKPSHTSARVLGSRAGRSRTPKQIPEMKPACANCSYRSP